MPAIGERSKRPGLAIGGVFTEDDMRACSLRKIAGDYGLTNIAYVILSMPAQADFCLCGVHTYSSAWWSLYLTKRYVNIDPVVRHCQTGVLPIDWRDLRNMTPEEEGFIKEAGEHGVGRNGLSYPIHGARGETAMLSLSSTRPDDEWSVLKQGFFHEFQAFAIQFHASFLKRYGPPTSSVDLTSRELECLKWAAAGKTAWETCMILGIAEKTVEFHMDRARIKLGAANKVQAVAKAVRLKLI